MKTKSPFILISICVCVFVCLDEGDIVDEGRYGSQKNVICRSVALGRRRRGVRKVLIDCAANGRIKGMCIDMCEVVAGGRGRGSMSAEIIYNRV